MDGISKLLADHWFAELFRDELGWDRSSGNLAVDVGERQLELKAIAQKRGFQVLQCVADRRVLFNRGLLRRAQRLVTKTFHEHIVIYSCSRPPKQVWQWAVWMPDGRKLRHREHPFFSGSPPASLLSRLKALRFLLDEEASVTIVDALDRVRTVLDVSPEVNLFARRPYFAERSDELAVAMAHGDESAFHAFIVLHRPLARHVSKRLQHAFGMDPEDAEQIGIIGLIAAARRFDPERGTQFSTYATHWIRQACQRFGPGAALPIRLPAHIVESFLPLYRRIKRLASEHGPGRANDELARLCAADGRFFRQWLSVERALNVRSLSDAREPEYYEARSLVAEGEDDAVDQQLDRERVERIRAAIARLRERDRRVLRLRYGIDGSPMTLEEIGQAEGITRERVRQIQVRAERKLRSLLVHELKDLVPTQGVVARASSVAGAAPTGKASGDALGSPGVSVLTQEELQLAEFDLEGGQKTAEHIADAVGGQVAFHEQAIVHLESLAK
jgi:RNA polymerase primary sigma factor